MELIGSTAIEDKLQEDVADTIRFIRRAGIRVWVLTGDKIETAINIGLSAALIDQMMTLFTIDQLAVPSLQSELQQCLYEMSTKAQKSSRSRQALVVAGASLIIIDSNNELRELFLQVSDQVDVVLACRVSPKQKADVVGMVKRRYPEKRTLSIGDGANDVSMILGAHVGVGILGKEGQQAARSADYAIG